MIVDFDDFSEDNHRYDLLHELRSENPAFRCTLFAIPGKGSDEFWSAVPDWCELAVHGWLHPHPREAASWTYEEAEAVLAKRPAAFVCGFKAPGWQISDATYAVLQEHGWWVADHWENDGRRPSGLAVHVISRASAINADPRHWHGHIGNVCGNGIEETFGVLLQRVRDADSFQFISEVVQ